MPPRPIHSLRRCWLRMMVLLALAGRGTGLAGPIELPGLNGDGGEFPLWDHLLTLKAGGGYKNNALLAAFNPQDTPLVTAGIELFLTRLPADGHQWTVFFTGDQRRYVDPVQLSSDQPAATQELLLLSQVSYKHYGARWIQGLSFTHLHAEQAFDATDLGGQPGMIRASGHAFILTPSLRYPLPRGVFLQADYVLTRQLFQSPVSSYWEFGPRVSAGWQYRTNGSIEVSYQYTERPFDSRLQTDPLGQSLADTSLTTFDNRYEVSWKQTWYAPRKFLTTVRGFRISRVENGEGFSDYNRLGGSITTQLEYGKWAFRGLARWSTFDFDLQIVSVFDPVPRTREETEFEGRIEYRWTPRFRTYAEYLHERQRSNVQADHFHANTWQAGVEVDF